MKRLSKVINGRSSSKAEKIAAQKVKFASLHEKKEEEEDDDEEEAVDRMRHNPKKTVRVSISKNVVTQQQKFVCNKCGKAFQSSKAMCGHMASHSEKEKPLSKAAAKKKLVMMDSESDSESGAGAGQMMRRSMRTRYKKDDKVAESKVKIDVVNNCSSEASGIEEEQEVAICLMMLSRDSSSWGGLNSFGDSSDNNSVVMEDRSISTRMVKMDALSSKYDLNEIKEKHQMKKVELSSDFDSRFVRNGSRNVEADVKIRKLRKDSLEEDVKLEPHLSLNKIKSLMDGEGYSQIQRPKMDYISGRGAFNESYGGEMYTRVEHMPWSHRPFDVNVLGNKQFSAAFPYESGQNSFDTDAYYKMLKGKGMLDHNTGNVGDFSPLAFNRAMHFTEWSDDNKCDEVTANFKRNGVQSHDFIDLNLPAPMEDEEANESMGSY